MSKKSSIEKNKMRTRLVNKFKLQRTKLKEIIMNKNVSIEERFDAQLKLAKLPRNSARNRLRNRCLLSGRPRGYYRRFKLSRIALRDLAAVKQIPGMIKASW
ncbi:Ribosomal protein S14 [Rickettsiales bacterium Ac37b]|nr:Ribosomal protein S14 [Rickettsiales bacterium Ac37b]